MEIGGYDLIFTTSLTNREVKKGVFDIVKKHWPDLVVEEDKEPFMPKLTEPSYQYWMFIHKDRAAKESWDVDCTDENANDMISLILEEAKQQDVSKPIHLFTVVVGERRGNPIVDDLVSKFGKYNQ